MEDLENLKSLYFAETSAGKRRGYKQEIDKLISNITHGNKDFDFEVYFSEVFREKKGFDVVIANPPYVKKENLDLNTIKQIKKHFVEKKNGKPKQWSDDLYTHFIFRGTEIDRDEGVITYIANDSFIGLTSKIRVRHLLLKYSLLKLIRCPMETFDATIYTAVFVLQKSESKNQAYESGHFTYPKFQYETLGQVPHNVVSALPNKRLVFASPIFRIWEKLATSKKTGNYLSILDTGIHSGNVREKIFFKEKTKEGLCRLLQGKQIKRWGIFWKMDGCKYKYCDTEYIPKKQKGIGRKGRPSKHHEYWHFCGDIKNHHQPERLLIRQSDDDLVVAYQNEKEYGRFYTDNTLFTILPKHKKTQKDILKYAMALLNSKLLNTIYHFLSQEKGKTLAQIKTKLVEGLPFKVNSQDSIIVLVDKILAITKDNDYLINIAKQTKVQEYEKQIDRLVYKLYGLTSKEIEIVEDAARN